MTKGFGFALVAAAVVVTCTAVRSIAEESHEAKQGCCDKNKDCCDQGKECGQDGNCTSGKCKDCKNANCNVAICSGEGCDKSHGKIAGELCASCVESGCHCDALGYVGCSKRDCESGKYYSNSSCDTVGACAATGRGANVETSALRMTGYSLFDVASPSMDPAATDEMWQLIAEELECSPRRCISIASIPSPQSKSVYLVLEKPCGGDYAICKKCDSQTTVGSVLRGAVLPHPVNFATAEIAVHRTRPVVEDGKSIEVNEGILPVRWDQATGEPTKCTNHALQAGDRVCVKLAGATDSASRATAAAYAPEAPMPRPAGAAPYQKVTTTDEVKQIQYSINIVEDCGRCLGEYEALRTGAPMMFAESKTLLPAMRAMHKHQLIRQLSSPKLMCTVGQTAQLEIAGESSTDDAKEWEGIRLEVTAEEAENGLMVKLAMHATENKRRFEVRTALLVEPGQTIVLNANAAPAPEGEKQSEQAAVYVVVTPEVVK